MNKLFALLIGSACILLLCNGCVSDSKEDQAPGVDTGEGKPGSFDLWNDSPSMDESVSWEKSFGGSGEEIPAAVLETADGGFIVAGSSESYNGDVMDNYGSSDVWVMKLDYAGRIEWQKIYGGRGADRASAIQESADGGYVIAGSTESDDRDVSKNHGKSDFWVIKIDSGGKLLWQNTYGGSEDESAQSVRPTADGGYIVAGITYSSDGDVSGYHGNGDAWLVKLGPTGGLQWQKAVGGKEEDRAKSIIQCVDGGYVMVGDTLSDEGDASGNRGNGDFWVVRLGKGGAIQWEKTLGGIYKDSASSVRQTSDQGYIVTGITKSEYLDIAWNSFSFGFWVSKLNNKGVLRWETILEGNFDDNALSINLAEDGGYIATGYRWTAAQGTGVGDSGQQGSTDFWVKKLDSSGKLEWHQRFKGSGHDGPFSIRSTKEGGYILAGTTESDSRDTSGIHGKYDIWVVRLDLPGVYKPSAETETIDPRIKLMKELEEKKTVSWQTSIGGYGMDEAYSAHETADGGCIVAGGSASKNPYSWQNWVNHGEDDFFVVKLDAAGLPHWYGSFGGSRDDVAHSVQPTVDGGYILAGSSSSNDGDVTGNHGKADFWVVKTNSEGKLVWQKTLGGTGTDCANSIRQTADGGYIVAGATDSKNGDVTGNHGNMDIWIVKLAPTGKIEWQKTLGGSKNDEASSIEQVKDGGYIIAGKSDSKDGDVAENRGYSDAWVVRLGNKGDLVWQRSFSGSGADSVASIQQTSDGGFIATGSTTSDDGDLSGNHGESDLWVLKLSSLGKLQWQKLIGGSREDFGAEIRVTADAGYILCGTTRSNDGDVRGNQGGSDFWVIKLDPAGTIQWQQVLGGTYDDFSDSIAQATDGGYIVSGLCYVIDGDAKEFGPSEYQNQIWVVKLDPNGAFFNSTAGIYRPAFSNDKAVPKNAILWQQCLGRGGSDAAYSIQPTSDGGYIVSGATDSKDQDVSGKYGSDNCWIAKLGSAGKMSWQRIYGGLGRDVLHSLKGTPDGGFVFAGFSESINGDFSGNHGKSDFLVMKTNSRGELQWQRLLGGSEVDEAYSIDTTPDGGFIVAGMTESNDGDVTGNHGDKDYWVVKLDSKGAIQWQNALGGSEYDAATSVYRTLDGGCIVAGCAMSNSNDIIGLHGNGDAWLVKLDSKGTIEWKSVLGGSGWDSAESVLQTADGGYIFAGKTYSKDFDVSWNNGSADFWIVKVDPRGAIQWEKTCGGGSNDEASSIIQTADGGYVAAGFTLSNSMYVSGNHGKSDCWLVKLSSAGKFLWQKAFGGSDDDTAARFD